MGAESADEKSARPAEQPKRESPTDGYEVPVDPQEAVECEDCQ